MPLHVYQEEVGYCILPREQLKRLFITIRENLEEMYFEGEPKVLVEWFREWEVKVGVPKCAIMHLRKGELPDTE